MHFKKPNKRFSQKPNNKSNINSGKSKANQEEKP